MRRSFLNPFTVLAATVGLFLAMRGEFGVPSSGWPALLFLAAFGYACAAAYLAVFLTSDWIPVLKKLEFPAAYGNKVFMVGMGFATMLPRTLIGSAIAIFALGIHPSEVVAFSGALLALAAAAATVPIMRSPSATAH